ncbi:MAG: tetratricopeptide repeat protein [Gammaproteobacteria bacterium]|nr:tetratricopeptide repeat protein [Gammaproteobacteria bacterium]
MPLITNLEAMLARGQDSALLRYGLGGAYLKAGEPERAIEHLRQAVVRDPVYSAAWKLLGKALADTGRTDEAIKAYEDGLRVAEAKGDKQTTREIAVFLKRLRK